MVLATVPAAPPAEKNQRATSWPAPISANVPYVFASRLSASAFCRVPVAFSMVSYLEKGRARIPSSRWTLRKRGLHDQHGTCRFANDLLGYASHEDSIQPSPPARPPYYQIAFGFF